jgi:outer membrane receptor protein involved in Fe transport
MLPVSVAVSPQQQQGSIRGVVRDRELDSPLGGVQVVAVETGQKVVTTDQGNFIFPQVAPGKYTLSFTKDGYARQVKSDVVVAAGQLTDVDVALAGEVTEMDELVAQDLLRVDAGSEAALLKLRFESAALMDSIGADLISRAGVSDAAAALRLVAGASTAQNKSAVVRGLPDRYVSSQMNGIVMPSADSDKRAIQLDQFPAAVIESIQVTKTFTPDQQGDASGGAVNLRLKSIPDEGILQVKVEGKYNSQVANRDDFLTYPGGGVSHWGFDDGGRDIQFDHLGGNWTGATGTSLGDAPSQYKWSFTAGGKHEIADGVKIGGLASFYYEQYSSYYTNGQDNSYWVDHPGGPMVPQHFQNNGSDDFKTALYDVTRGTQGVRWGALGTLGLESESNVLGLTYLFTHTAEDVSTLATDTRGKAFFFPGYDVHDPMGEGNMQANRTIAPYLRLETLEYTERTTESLILNGWHKLPVGAFDIGDLFKVHPAEFDWLAALSSSDLNQPDKRQFGAIWYPRYYNPGIPGLEPPFFVGPEWDTLKPAQNVNLGNLQRTWTNVNEESLQYALNLKFPFEQWNDAEGFMKVGYYDNHVDRTFTQSTFSNFGDTNTSFSGAWTDPWSAVFPDQNHPITASQADVDYKGKLDVSAYYGMLDLPLVQSLDLIGGARFETTSISTVVMPEPFAFWFPPGYGQEQNLTPGIADVDFHENDVLPSIGLVYRPWDPLTLRASYAKTVARQTFKELTPIVQQEYEGGPTFIGNPSLLMSKLTNYDLRADYSPTEGSLLSASWFYKDIKDPIEYVQQDPGFVYTTAENYPKGELHGYELEVRQGLGRLWEPMDGFSVGANATFIHSQVTLPESEAIRFDDPAIKAPMSTRDMTNAPDHLFNFYFTYDLVSWGTQAGLFYTIQGDTLVAGATTTLGNFVPNVYAKEFGTLNLTVSQKIWKYFTLQFQAKNLTNPNIETVYRSPYIGNDVLKTTYSQGIDYSLSLTATFGF